MTWFVTAVGGPQKKNNDMPTVTMLDEPETAVAAVGEVQNKEPLFDPMAELNEIEDSPPLETPKKKRPLKTNARKPPNVKYGAHAKTTALRSM